MEDLTALFFSIYELKKQKAVHISWEKNVCYRRNLQTLNFE